MNRARHPRLRSFNSGYQRRFRGGPCAAFPRLARRIFSGFCPMLMRNVSHDPDIKMANATVGQLSRVTQNSRSVIGLTVKHGVRYLRRRSVWRAASQPSPLRSSRGRRRLAYRAKANRRAGTGGASGLRPPDPFRKNGFAAPWRLSLRRTAPRHAIECANSANVFGKSQTEIS